MKPIVNDPDPGSQRREVANLQDALSILLLRGHILANDPDLRRELLQALEPEHAESVYNDATQKVVRIFQEERGLQPHGTVDARTAGALNALLRELGLLDEAGPDPERGRVVSGVVRRDDGLPAGGVLVRASDQGGGAAVRLGEDTTDAEGRYTVRYGLLPGQDAVRLHVAALGDDGRTLASSDIERAKPVETVDLVATVTGAQVGERSIVGRVSLEDGRPAGNVTLMLKRRDFGGGATQMGTATTLSDGRYALSFDPGPAGASLEIVALDPTGKEVPLSAQLNYLGNQSSITRDLTAPGDLAPRAAEFRRLAADLQPQIGEITALAGAQETAERSDLTALNRVTGWDARLLAQGALAARLSADEQTPTSVEGFYGLLRAGLPSDKVRVLSHRPTTSCRRTALVGGLRLRRGQPSEDGNQS